MENFRRCNCQLTDFQGELVVVNQDFSYNESIRRSFAEDIKGRTDSGGFLFDRKYTFPIKQKHFVQMMHTRTSRKDCFANVLGANKKDVLLIIASA